jgi:hypothetical protein
MANVIDIDKIESYIKNIKSFKPKTSWTSSKLWIMLTIVGALIWLFQANFQAILWPVTVIVGVWLICRTIQDIFSDKFKSQKDLELIKYLSKDGLTEKEIEIVKNS